MKRNILNVRFLLSVLMLLFVTINIGLAQMPPHTRVTEMLKNDAIIKTNYDQMIANAQQKWIDSPWRDILFNNEGIRLQKKPIAELEKNILGKSAGMTSYRSLVILVKFPDKNSSVSAATFDQVAFGSTGNSLRTYYNIVSRMTLDVITVNLPGELGWQQMPQNYTYYVNGNYGHGTYPQNAQKLAEDAVNAVDATVDFSQYDNDKDGYVDALMIVHAGSGAEFTSNKNDIWSHSWVMNGRKLHDGVYTYAYTIEPEYWENPGDMTCGVYAHEFGHMVFDLPDLYDTDNSSEGLGNWSLMAGGSWNGPGGKGGSPAFPDAWSRIQMGYADVVNIMSNKAGQSIQSAQTSSTIYRLWKNGNQTYEYFLVENRQQSGFDTYLPGSGLLIYHVDNSKYSNQQEWYPGLTTSGHYKVALEQSDNAYDLEKSNNRGDAGDPYPGSSNKRVFNASSLPNSDNYAGSSTAVGVLNISNSSASMSADLQVGSWLITVDQQLSNETRVGTIGKWNGSTFSTQLQPGQSILVNDGSTLILKGEQSIVLDEKYQFWKNKATGVLESTVKNHHEFSVIEDATYLSQLTGVSSASLKTTLDGVDYSAGSVQFRDPWMIDYNDPIYGNTPRNRGMADAVWTSVPSGTNNLGVGSNYKGVFKDLDPNIDPAITSYYKIQTASTANFSGQTAYFQYWWPDGASLSNWNSGAEQPVVFTSDNAIVTANYKGHLRTGAPELSDTKNQTRFVIDPQNANRLLLVYESMTQIWVTMSLDGGITWKEEFSLGYGRNPSISNVLVPGQSLPSRILIVWNGTTEDSQQVAPLYFASMRLDYDSVVYPETKGYNMGWQPVTVYFDPETGYQKSYTGDLSYEPPATSFNCKPSTRPVASLIPVANGMKYIVVAENGGISGSESYAWSRGLDYTYGTYTGQSDINFSTWSPHWNNRISENESDSQPVIISYPAATGFPARSMVYYLGTGYASGKRIIEYDLATQVKRVLTTATNDYTYLSLSGASNETSASFALVATAQVNYPATSYNTNIYTKPTYYGNGLPTVAKVYSGKINPAIMVQNTPYVGAPVYQVHMTTYGTSTRVKADGGSSVTTVANSTAGSWLSAQVGSGIRKAMVVRNTTSPATIQYYDGTTQLSKSGDEVADVRAYRFYTLKNGTSGSAILDFSGSQVESIDSLETGENLAVVQIKNPASSGIIVHQPDCLVVPLSVDVIRDGKEIAAYAASSWKALGSASFTDLQEGDVLRFRLAVPVSAVWGYEVYTDSGENLAKQDTQPGAVTELESLTEGIRIYPNPFNPVTTIQISLAEPKAVRLAVYNLLGQQVSELVSGDLEAGRHSFPFNGSNLSSGTYFYRLETAGEVKTGKLQLLK